MSNDIHKDTPLDPTVRAALWSDEARQIVAQMREYEQNHPHVDEGVPCFLTALSHADAALTDAAKLLLDAAGKAAS